MQDVSAMARFCNGYLFGQTFMRPLGKVTFQMLIKTEWRFLLFGFFMSFWSSLGQTFFISLFSSEIRADLGLSHGAFGSYYALATTLSALTLFWLGKLADTIAVPRLSVMTLGGYVWLPCISLLSIGFNADNRHLFSAPVRTGDDVSCLFHSCDAPLFKGSRARTGCFRFWDECG